MSKIKILILYTSIGGGIKATAVNAAEQLADKYEVRIEDIETVERGLFATAIQGSYSGILEHFSSLWGWLYDSKIILGALMPLRKFIASFKSKHVLQILRQYQPAIVISTSVNVSAIMAYLKSKGLYRGKLVIVFSDYHLQRFWLHHEADLFVCNIPQQIPELKHRGYGEVPTALTGTLIAQKFFKVIDRDEARDQLGLLKSMPLVLIGGAGKTRSVMREVFRQLIRSPKSFQVAVLCGKNRELQTELAQLSAPDRHPVKILGFIENMDVWMAAANVLVYKTGGPSMAEAVVKKLPIVFVDIRPGHELHNLNYLVAHGIGQYGRTPREAQYLVEEILGGKLKFDHEQGMNAIVKPAGQIRLIDAIDRLYLKD